MKEQQYKTSIKIVQLLLFYTSAVKSLSIALIQRFNKVVLSWNSTILKGFLGVFLGFKCFLCFLMKEVITLQFSIFIKSIMFKLLKLKL